MPRAIVNGLMTNPWTRKSRTRTFSFAKSHCSFICWLNCLRHLLLALPFTLKHCFLVCLYIISYHRDNRQSGESLWIPGLPSYSYGSLSEGALWALIRWPWLGLSICLSLSYSRANLRNSLSLKSFNYFSLWNNFHKQANILLFFTTPTKLFSLTFLCGSSKNSWKIPITPCLLLFYWTHHNPPPCSLSLRLSSVVSDFDTHYVDSI